MWTSTTCFALALLALSGCATTDNRSSRLPIATLSDEHAEFNSLSAVPKDKGLEVSGWASSKQALVAGAVHIEALSAGTVVADADVSWRGRVSGVRLSRIRAGGSSFYFSKILPPQSLSADAVRVSHGHRGHADISREEDNK